MSYTIDTVVGSTHQICLHASIGSSMDWRRPGTAAARDAPTSGPPPVPKEFSQSRVEDVA